MPQFGTLFEEQMRNIDESWGHEKRKKLEHSGDEWSPNLGGGGKIPFMYEKWDEN
jgi:hypothetical protein